MLRHRSPLVWGWWLASPTRVTTRAGGTCPIRDPTAASFTTRTSGLATLTLLLGLSIRIRVFMRAWMPTNILLDAIRTRRGLKWGIPAMITLAPAYLGIAYWLPQLIARGAPE